MPGIRPFARGHVLLILLMVASCQAPRPDSGADIRFIEPNPATGSSAAVVVEPAPLAVTTNFLPYDPEGKLVGADDPDAQIAQVLRNVDIALASVGSDRSDLVKLNVYVRSNALTERVRRRFAESFDGEAKPAVTFAVGKLRDPQVDVAMDVVAVVRKVVDEREMIRTSEIYGHSDRAHLAILPPQGHVYVSGQVARGDDLIAAARETFESSLARLSYLGLPASSIEQVKIFLHDIEGVDSVETAIAEYFRRKPAPPIVSLEWVHRGFDIEIEMIASRTDISNADTTEAITYSTPPGLTATPVYSRIATIKNGDIVYVSGTYGDSTLAGEEQIRSIYALFERILPQTGTDFSHLAKGQYYVTDWSVVRPLGTVRGDYYPPDRPPTSSLIPVRGLGTPGPLISIDLIGVAPRQASRP